MTVVMFRMSDGLFIGYRCVVVYMDRVVLRKFQLFLVGIYNSALWLNRFGGSS